MDTAPGNTTKGNTEPDSDDTFSQTENTSDDYVEDLIEGKVNDSVGEDDGDDGDSNVEVIYDRKVANAASINNNACNRPAAAVKQEFVHFHPVGVLSKQQVSNK